MPSLIDEAIAQIHEATRRQPIDWSAIRGAAMTLDREARTTEQKAAVEQLKRAADSTRVSMAVIAIERAFLQGKSGDDGWPRKF
jgi:hypothetical protein